MNGVSFVVKKRNELRGKKMMEGREEKNTFYVRDIIGGGDDDYVDGGAVADDYTPP